MMIQSTEWKHLLVKDTHEWNAVELESSQSNPEEQIVEEWRNSGRKTIKTR